MKRTMRLLVVLVMAGAMALAGMVATNVAAQDDGFPISVVAAMCPEDYPGPFVGCEPWVAAQISVVSADGAINETCVTPEAEAEARVSSCGYVVPFSSTITATLLSDIPDGWVLSSSDVQTVEIPDSPPDGVFGGPVFVVQPADSTGQQPPASGGSTVDDDNGVTELPTTGRGSDVAVADTQDIVAAEIVRTIMVLAAVVSLAFGALALYARQKEL